MKEFDSLGLRYVHKRLEVLDQRLLPHEEVWRHVEHPHEMERLIAHLSLRGAPLIGVAAAVILALYAEQGAKPEQVAATAAVLRGVRPTAITLMKAVDAVMAKSPDVEKMVAVAEAIIEAEAQRSEQIAAYGADLIQDGEGIVTLSNTGGLATVGVGTAIGIVRRAHEQGKEVCVYVSETRPLLQGARLACWELDRLRIPYILICDSMSAVVMKQGKAHRVLVGADRIASNGDFANKVGTYSLAVQAKYHNIPFHVVAPTSTLDLNCMTGTDIPIEERSVKEVQGVRGYFGEVYWSPPNAPAYNPAFDVTQVELVTSMILDTGVYTQQMLQEGALMQLKPQSVEVACILEMR